MLRDFISKKYIVQPSQINSIEYNSEELFTGNFSDDIYKDGELHTTIKFSLIDEDESSFYSIIVTDPSILFDISENYLKGKFRTKFRIEEIFELNENSKEEYFSINIVFNEDEE